MFVWLGCDKDKGIIIIGIVLSTIMGKKVKNAKLLKGEPKQSMASMFNQYADRLAKSHSKKIEKVGDTKQRLMDNKKRNRMVKVSKRTSKFALMD